MRSGAEMLRILEAIEQLFCYSLFAVAAVVAATGLFILLFRVPARVSVVSDGLKRAERDSRAATTLNGVYTNDVKPYASRVDDDLEFLTRDGREIRFSARRALYKSDPPSLIWYSPKDPRRATAMNPIRCFGLACLCVGAAICLRW